MTKISATLRAAILGGAVGLLPSIALADSGSSGKEAATVPDHAAAEARSMGDTATSTPEAPAGVPDHAAAEARSIGETNNWSTGRTVGAQDRGVPDHAAAERRGAPESAPQSD